MSEHLHDRFVEGCYRCDLSADEVRPRRIQLRRTKGWRKPEGAVVVARPSKWGNPWSLVQGDGAWLIDGPCAVTFRPFADRASAAAKAVEMYGEYAVVGCAGGLRPTWTLDDVEADLCGHDLACWCPLDQPCHADVLLELANP